MRYKTVGRRSLLPCRLFLVGPALAVRLCLVKSGLTNAYSGGWMSGRLFCDVFGWVCCSHVPSDKAQGLPTSFWDSRVPSLQTLRTLAMELAMEPHRQQAGSGVLCVSPLMSLGACSSAIRTTIGLCVGRP
jgi:hypothetical protein